MGRCSAFSFHLIRLMGTIRGMSCVLHTTNLIFHSCPNSDSNLSATYVPRSLLVSTASGEREDALPQTPECTDCTGLFKEAAGKDPSEWSRLSGRARLVHQFVEACLVWISLTLADVLIFLFCADLKGSLFTTFVLRLPEMRIVKPEEC